MALAELHPSGIVRAISAAGRRRWGWTEGSRIPNVLRIGLSEQDPDRLDLLPISPGGPSVLAIRVEAGWLLLHPGTSYDAGGEDESSFRSLIENLPVCVTVLRADGTVAYANAEAAAMTGYDVDEMEGRPFWMDAVHPEDRWKLIGAQRHAIEGEPASVSVRFLSRRRGPRLADIHFFSSSASQEALVECVAFDVTERSEVEEALFQSEALYRIFLEQSPVGMLHVDAAGTVTFENHQFRQITGEAAEDAWIGRSISEIEGLDPSAKALIRDLLARGEAFHGETAVYRGRAVPQHLQIHGSPIHHPEGGIVGGVLMVEDRSEEVRRKEELHLRSRYAAAESELRKAALAGGAQQDFLGKAARIFGESTCADRVYLLLNNAAGDCCTHRARWRRAGVAEPPPVVIMHGEDQVLQTIASAKRSVHARRQVADGDGRALLEQTGAQEAIWTPFFDESRLGGFVVLERVDVSHDGAPATWRDTERRLAEQLVRLFETLWSWMQAGNRYRHITSTIEDCLFTFTFDEDGERHFLFLTPQIEPLTGYAPEQVLGREIGGGRWSDVLVYEDDQTLVDAHDDALRSGRESRITYRIRHRDGTVRWLQEQATPEIDGMGDVIVSGILADITEQKAAEEVLTNAKQQAESANRLKSAFIATMSHEIRTPMGAVNGFAELLTRELAELESSGILIPPQVIEFLQAIRDNSKRLLTLVNDLFDLSNLEVGSIDLVKTEVPFHEIVMRSTSKVAVPLSRKGVDLRVDLADGDPVVLGDPQRLEQVMDNLLSNAVKFTDEGYVQVRSRVEDGWIAVEVVDTGVGISGNHLEGLFEPFVQEDSRLNRRFEGSGLGLSLAKRLLSLMDGAIEVESEKGEGSLFRVRLPEQRAAAVSRPVRFEG